jgi:hypothetical protein
MSRSSNIKQLFENAEAEGKLSPQSYQALTVVDLGAQIQAALGARLDDVASSEVVLVTMMPDDSGSIFYAGNAKVVREGHNHVIEALRRTKQKDSLLVHTRYLNGQVLFPYCGVEQALGLDAQNYHPSGGTPLYDQTVVLLGTVVAKAQEFSEGGVAVRTVTLIISDGADLHSQHATPPTVRALVQDMLKSEIHIIGAMGIDDGTTDFRRIYREMGIEDRWILTPGNSASEIRAAFQLFSQSAVRASQGIGSFGQTALGGFGIN